MSCLCFYRKTFTPGPLRALLTMALVQSEPSLPKPRPLGPSQPTGKRRCSMGGGFRAPAKRRRRAISESQSERVLPSHFLLGGNIFDPLNLNSLPLQGPANQDTPQSSPLPPRGDDPVEIRKPRDITDPLNLKGAPPQRRRRHRHRHSTTANTTANTTADLSPLSCELNTALTCREDLAPPSQRRHTHPPLHRRRRSASTCVATAHPNLSQSGSRRRRRAEPKEPGESHDHTPWQQFSFVSRPRPSRRRSRSKRRSRFEFGNCSKFYGFSSCYGDGEGQVGGADPRLTLLEAGWFRGRRVLDVGCGAGHVTLYVARSFGPAHILGVELDAHLLRAANQNVRHFLSHDLVREERRACPRSLKGRVLSGGVSLRFPQSFRATRGPLAPPLLQMETSEQNFPHNVSFLQGDYVCEQEAWPGRGLYDVVLCLGVVKWVQLQKGDEGVARLFRRAYQSLSPGGLFLLETQPWTSYCHRDTFRIFKTLRLRPEKFTSFLTETIGFSSYRLLTCPGTPSAQSMKISGHFSLVRKRITLSKYFS
uniref:RNA methyltransferase n=1 Tax=Neogobius melanostomus TaxID=47308 RepID=A0A8C6SLX3_9GOBI